MVTGDGGDSYEVLYAYQRFQEADWEPVVAAPVRRRLHMVVYDQEPGWETYVERPGFTLEADVAVTAVAAREFTALMLLGGRAPEYLRNDASVISLVREFARLNKCIFAIGHGIQLLTAADLVKGRIVAPHPNVRIEVERAGGISSDEIAIRDDRMVTAHGWKAHPLFYRVVFACLGQPA